MNFPVFDLHCDTALRLLGDDATSHIDGIEDDRATRAGVYEVPVQADSGKSYTLRLKVIDRVAPVVTPRHVYSALGQTAPVAEDFIGSIKEYDSFSAAFVSLILPYCIISIAFCILRLFIYFCTVSPVAFLNVLDMYDGV